MTHTVEKIAKPCISVLLACLLALVGAVPAFGETTEDADSAEDTSQLPTSQITDEDIAATLQGIDAADSADSGSAEGAATVLSLAASAESQVVEIAGSTLYDTAAAEALYAYDSSECVIVASGTSYADALSATSLAGALDCPILLTEAKSLPQATSDALGALNPSSVIVVGGRSVVSDDVAGALGVYGTVKRLYGATQYDTQVALYEYGEELGLWSSGMVIVANGTQFADALSVSSVAFKQKAPVFLVDENGSLPDASADALLASNFTEAIVAGGRAVVSDRTFGFLQFVTLANGGERSVTRLSGTTLYDTSAAIAQWAVGQGILTWNGAAFATALQPYDALAGSVVQGREGSVLLLIDTGSTATLNAIASSGAAVSTVKFFGGRAAVKGSTRIAVCSALGIPCSSITYRDYNISLSMLADIEYGQLSDEMKKDVSWDAVYSALTPSDSLDQASVYQFAVLNEGYSGVSADDLNRYIDSMVSYQEGNYGVTSNLRGTGAYFVEAAQTYGINEVYLLAHAALESAWGCSTLAQGRVSGYEGYLNFYGIGAYDTDPHNGGAAMAKNQGWTNQRLAILGAARWISGNYLNSTAPSAAVSGSQNTLYKMKWDVQRAAAGGSPWHQYATGITWATGVASVMNGVYSYCGKKPYQTCLVFEVPRYW